jgi:DNA-binding transcriptional ArsR family regulator
MVDEFEADMPATTARRVSSPVMNPEELAEYGGDAERLLKALSNRNRLMVLCLLIEGELSVGELLERIPLSQSALSQHLAMMRRDDLVRTGRKSQTICYSLAGDKAARVVGLLHDMYCDGE